jgi:hypothetical protein
LVKYQRRKHYVLKLRRRVVGVSAFGEDTGKSRAGVSMFAGADQAINYASSSKVWRCTRDALPAERPEVGEYRNEQSWEYYSKWEDVDLDDFGGGS